MGLIERAEAIERERRSLSMTRFGHPGASIPGYWMDWQAEALALEQQLQGAVSAETLWDAYYAKAQRDNVGPDLTWADIEWLAAALRGQ